MATTMIAPPLTSLEGAQKGRSDIWSWLSTTDHKRIGQLYLFTSLRRFFLVGGIEAMIIRIQLARPNDA